MSTIWDPFTQENQIKIEMVQRRAARFACNYRREASVITMLDELGWRSLKQRRADQILILLYKIVNNLVEVDLSTELILCTYEGIYFIVESNKCTGNIHSV